MKTRLGVVFAATVWGLWTGANLEAQGLSPAAVDSLYRRASSMDAEGIRALAKRLEGAVSGYTNPSRLLTRIGQLYLRVGEADSARSAFQRAVERGPGLTSAHVGLGRVYLELKDDPKGALPHLDAALKADSTYTWTHTFLARALTQIGGLFLRAELADSARSAFQRAIGHDPKLTAAHLGLGRVYLELKDDPKGALPHLEAAVEADSTNVEAHYVLARAYREMERLEAKHAADRAIRYNPQYAPAYLLLAQAYQEEGNRQATVFYYKKYLEQKPKDQEPAYAFALDLMQKRRFKELEEITSLMIDRRALPLLAHALMRRGDYEGAMGAFELYAETLDPVERKLYTDISLVGLPHEIKAYKTTPPEKREAFLRQFWLRHDPFKASGGSMRRAEHYRRVWDARTYYGKVKFPWDRRGEVYIRYGEPDYRSSSEDMNAKIPPAVQRVQDQMAYELYGAQGLGITFVGPVFPIRTGVGSYRGLPGDLRIAGSDPEGPISDPFSAISPGERQYEADDIAPQEIFPETVVKLDPEFVVGLSGWKPVTVGNNWATVPWEVWVYADVGKGLEIAFTDEYLSGVYDYAPIPGVDERDLKRLDEDRFVGETAYLRLMQRLTELAPAIRVAKVVREEPERYDISGFEPLDFYYDVASFRGRKGLTEVQVNIGIPIDHVIQPGDTDTTVVVDRRVALIGSRYTHLLPAQRSLEAPISGLGRNRALLDRVLMEASPGNYELAVQAGRRGTRLLQSYLQDLKLQDYSGKDLGLSDLLVAKRVTAATEATSDPRFVRGKWRITPLPSHVFQVGQHVFVYSEIYNLMRDEFGATRYEVAYELHATGTEGTVLSPILTRILGRQSEAAVTVRYEQTGTEESVSDYVELDIGKAESRRYRVRMTVKDLNSGQEVSKEGMFWVATSESR
jgi:GWxTD domain-containing protein